MSSAFSHAGLPCTRPFFGPFGEHFRFLDIALVEACQGGREIRFGDAPELAVGLGFKPVSEIGLVLIHKGNAKHFQRFLRASVVAFQDRLREFDAHIVRVRRKRNRLAKRPAASFAFPLSNRNVPLSS